MQKWEHLYVQTAAIYSDQVDLLMNGEVRRFPYRFPDDYWKIFTDLGEEGWELAAIHETSKPFLIFKRPKL